MTASEFVRDIWLNSDEYRTTMDIDTARHDLATFASAGWNIPDDMTPETYTEMWNNLVNNKEEE